MVGADGLAAGLDPCAYLYPLGDSIEAWATKALELVQGDRLIVVGCSVGGSCALEVARLAPDRVDTLVLIGTKAGHRPDASLRTDALDALHEKGMEHAWRVFWEPLFSTETCRQAVQDARRIALRQSVKDVAQGISVFHSRPSRDQFLSAFPRPIAVVSGADDVAPGPQASAAQAGRALHGRFHLVPGCGHYVPLERPDVLNSILRQVIDEASEPQA